MVAFIGGFGGQEMLMILAIALVIFGPKRIPSLARSLGKVSAQIRNANRQIQREIYSNIDPEEIMAESGNRPVAKRSQGAVSRHGESVQPPPAAAAPPDPYADEPLREPGEEEAAPTEKPGPENK
jgi:sec-independent protein translocase protein TatA